MSLFDVTAKGTPEPYTRSIGIQTPKGVAPQPRINTTANFVATPTAQPRSNAAANFVATPTAQPQGDWRKSQVGVTDTYHGPVVGASGGYQGGYIPGKYTGNLLSEAKPAYSQVVDRQDEVDAVNNLNQQYQTGTNKVLDAVEGLLAPIDAGIQKALTPVLDAFGNVVGHIDELTGKIVNSDAAQKVSEYAQPQVKQTAAGDDFMTSPGGAVSAALPGGLGVAATIGGAISKRNLDNIYEEHGNYNPETGIGYIGADTIPGVTTPLAVSPGLFEGSTTVSGSLEHAANQAPWADIDGDGRLNQTEIVQAMDPNSAQRVALAEQRATEARIQEERRQAAEAAEAEAARQRQLAQQAQLAQEAERARLAAEAARKAEEEAERQRRLSQVRDDQGTATSVNDRGQVFYNDDHDWSRPTQTTVSYGGNDNDSGGGGSSGGK